MKGFLKSFFTGCMLLISVVYTSARQPVCKKPFLFYAFHQVDVQEPEDAVHREKFAQIGVLQQKSLELVLANQSFQVVPTVHFNDIKHIQRGYILIGSVDYDRVKKDYRFSMSFLTMCGMQIADAETRFQLYETWDPGSLANAVMNALFAKVKIHEWELKERASKNVGLGGEFRGGEITLDMERALVKGQSTNVIVRVVDCDGQALPNKKITTTGTTGGTFTPATFTTDNFGSALVKFTKNADKIAIVKAQCETKNVAGCNDLYTGTTFVKGIEGVPVQIDIDYVENVWKSLKRATLPGVKISGGEETEGTFMTHFATLYHFPTSKMLAENTLVETGQSTRNAAKTVYAYETGDYTWGRGTAPAYIVAGPGNMVQATEPGEESSSSGSPDGETTSEVTFYLGKKGDSLNRATFMWNVEYKTSGDGIGSGGAILVKGDTSVKWKESKITDPKSIYKIKYVIEQEINVATELKEGNKAMKDLFGFDLDQLTGIIDPTNPQSGMAGAFGTRMIRVTILSPYVLQTY